eukprot:TRINITY_DN11512_c2_g1_i1.p1 TRINITY_DN11512_c2_g1~~TRINITY_DN11512_c2_g1_i1.p1  ORF type:complete len:1829 (+),score=573.22 TRINITY_DN11512_c2_g1_i1:44-5488(+)
MPNSEEEVKEVEDGKDDQEESGSGSSSGYSTDTDTSDSSSTNESAEKEKANGNGNEVRGVEIVQEVEGVLQRGDDEREAEDEKDGGDMDVDDAGKEEEESPPVEEVPVTAEEGDEDEKEEYENIQIQPSVEQDADEKETHEDGMLQAEANAEADATPTEEDTKDANEEDAVDPDKEHSDSAVPVEAPAEVPNGTPTSLPPTEKPKPPQKKVTFAKKDDCSLFVCRAFKLLLPNLNVKRYQNIKETTAEIIGLIDSPEMMPKTLKMPNSTVQASPLQVYTYILRVVCEFGDSKMVPVALDCMQKMMSFGDISDSTEGTLPLLTFAKRAKMPIPQGKEEDHPWKTERVGLLSEMIYAIAGCMSIEGVTLQILKGLLTGVTERQAHGWALRLAVSCIFQITIKSTGSPDNATARTTLTQVINWVFQRMEEVSRDIQRGTPSVNPFKLDQTVDPETLMTVHHSDASHVFIYICSVMEGIEVTEYTPIEAAEMRTLSSALELVQRLVQSCGSGFKETPSFLEAISKPLLTTLVRCVVSPVPSIIQSALNIFYVLVVNFKHCLKHEIAAMFTGVVLKVLESNHASYDQRMLILNMITKMAQTPQILVDIFVNYDCDINEENVFEKIMNCLSKFIMATHVDLDWLSVKQDQSMRAVALKAIVSVLTSFETWVKKCKAPDYSMNFGPNSAIFSEVEKQRKLKNLLEEISAAFNTKPKNGIQLLVTKGLAENNPRSIAEALDKYKKIDRGMVGEYLGEPTNVDVLVEWCSLTDMANVSLDEALKTFLQRISLPKEGQKVERILEYFAAAYYRMNPGGVCKSEEAVFVLAVGIVMLNTDLHNPRIDNKITKEKFKSQFRGVNNSADFDPVYLDAIYDRILNFPMEDLQYMATMNVKEPSTDAGSGLFAAFTSKRDKKVAAYAAESQRIINTTSSILHHDRENRYLIGHDIEHIKPMFSACWAALLACFSSRFESEDPLPEVLKLSIEGLCKGIHISAVFEMHTEREAFIRCLCSMTNAAEKRRLIGAKNIMAIKALLKIPFVDGDYLYGSWLPYLRTASEIEHLRDIGSRQRQRTSAEYTKAQLPSHQKRRSIDLSLDEAANAREVMLNIDEFGLQKVISHSTSHSMAGLKEFVTHLCTVAYEEVKMVNARTFLLEKVVEVASDNMGTRMLSIWKDIARLFTAVGTHTNTDIAEYGVDNLRQLVLKALSQPELIECAIQPELFDPFYGIMVSSLPTKQVRDLVLRCLLQLVQARSSEIGPGWPVILKALVSGITRHKEPLALDMTATIMMTVLSKDNIMNILPYIEEVVHCLTFIVSDTKLMPERSIQFADILAEFPLHVMDVSQDEEEWKTAWEWVFEGFSFLFLDPDVTVRSKCVDSLSKSLKAKGIPAGVWESWGTKFIVAVTLRPLSMVQVNKAEGYSHCRHHGVGGKVERAEQKEWGDVTLPEVVSKVVVGVAVEHLGEDGFAECILGVVAVLCKIAKRRDLKLVHLGMKSLAAFLKAATPHITSWPPFIMHLQALFKHSLLRTTPLQPYTNPPTTFPDHINDNTSFPTPAELCPPQYRHIVHHTPGSPEVRRPSGAPLVARLSSGSKLGKKQPEDDNEVWLALLYGPEDTAAEGSYYETESLLLEDLAIRCSRQAGLISILNTLLLGGELDWVGEDSPLGFQDFKKLHDCVKYCSETAGVFFCAELKEWRGKVDREYQEMVRRRRSQALVLNTGTLFKAYNAVSQELRDLARIHLLEDSLELITIYQSQPEACLEPALVAVVDQLLGLPQSDFANISKSFYSPLISIIPTDASKEVRVAVHSFLKAFYPGEEKGTTPL